VVVRERSGSNHIPSAFAAFAAFQYVLELSESAGIAILSVSRKLFTKRAIKAA